MNEKRSIECEWRKCKRESKMFIEWLEKKVNQSINRTFKSHGQKRKLLVVIVVLFCFSVETWIPEEKEKTVKVSDKCKKILMIDISSCCQSYMSEKERNLEFIEKVNISHNIPNKCKLQRSIWINDINRTNLEWRDKMNLEQLLFLDTIY